MRARSVAVVVMALAACGGTSKSHSNAAAPAAVPIAPAPVGQSPATTPPVEPAQPEPAKPEQVAIAEDPDAGGEIADPDAGGEAEGTMGGLGVRGTGAGGGGTGSGTIGIGTAGRLGAGGGTGQGYGAGAGKPGGVVGTGSPGRRPPPPPMQWGMPTVKGELDRDIVRRVFRRHSNELRYCYEKQLALAPKLRGLLVIKLVIDAEGKVTSASASGVHKEVEACAAARARTWLFPKPKSGVVSVTHPVTFSPP
ncbi:MAG: energy transducer TonB [Myxococcales bacterium]|nr:energy transducer TonB [Myxococcales bacterium]